MTNISPSPGLAEPQRVAAPFVFRSGGLFGGGEQVRSIDAAIKHLDRYPEDGIYHLRNGTLAQWLEGQDAEDLACLAREVVRQQEIDPRVILEKFLIGTGLVHRPRLSIRPKAVAPRYILAGQRAECVLGIRKGRGRGYLFGVLHANQPWIRIDPARFSGKPLEAVVSVSTETLPISRTPHTAAVLVESSATPQPVSLPVRFRVVGAPSTIHRFVVRPLVSLFLAAVIGSALGALMANSASALSTELMAKINLTVTPAAVPAAVVGLVWAILGLILGLQQPPAWPIWYANGRWLLRTLIWAATFTVLVGIGLLAWRTANPIEHLPAWTPSLVSIWLAMLALSIFPAALGELWSIRSTRGRTIVSRQQPLLRPGLLVLITAIFAIALVGSIRLAGPALRQVDAERTVEIAQRTIEERWVLLEGKVYQWVDDLTIRMYDRRAKP